jgi:hypothetical protein
VGRVTDEPNPPRLRYEIGAHVIELVRMQGTEYEGWIDGARRPFRVHTEDHRVGAESLDHDAVTETVDSSDLLDCLRNNATIDAHVDHVELQLGAGSQNILSVWIGIAGSNRIAYSVRRWEDNNYY